jgi:hypothetical protein
LPKINESKTNRKTAYMYYFFRTPFDLGVVYDLLQCVLVA